MVTPPLRGLSNTLQGEMEEITHPNLIVENPHRKISSKHLSYCWTNACVRILYIRGTSYLPVAWGLISNEVGGFIKSSIYLPQVIILKTTTEQYFFLRTPTMSNSNTCWTLQNLQRTGGDTVIISIQDTIPSLPDKRKRLGRKWKLSTPPKNGKYR